jgi:hypothetical protein
MIRALHGLAKLELMNPDLTGYVGHHATTCSPTAQILDWKANRQCIKYTSFNEVLTLSATEAAYMVLSMDAQSTTHFEKLLANVEQHRYMPAVVYEDNKGEVKVVNDSMASHRTQHIGIRHHYVL